MIPTNVIYILVAIIVVMIIIKLIHNKIQRKKVGTWYDSKRKLTYNILKSQVKNNKIYSLRNEIDFIDSYEITKEKRERYLIINYNGSEVKESLAIYIYSKREKLLYVYKHIDKRNTTSSVKIKLPKRFVYINFEPINLETKTNYFVPYTNLVLSSLYNTIIYVLIALSLLNLFFLFYFGNITIPYLVKGGFDLIVKTFVVATLFVYIVTFRRFKKEKTGIRRVVNEEN